MKWRKSLINIIRDLTKRTSLEELAFPPLATFQRMIVHHVAGYFQLNRSVGGSAESYKRPMVVIKTEHSFMCVLPRCGG